MSTNPDESAIVELAPPEALAADGVVETPDLDAEAETDCLVKPAEEATEAVVVVFEASICARTVALNLPVMESISNFAE